MTAKAVIEGGIRYRHGSTAQQDRDTERRFALLRWTLEARRLNLRTANRKYRRRNGLSFANA